jgi:hypothetical protein
MVAPVAAAVDLDALAGGPSECLDHCRGDGLLA